MTRDLRWLRDSFRAIDRVYFSDSLTERGVTIGWMRWQPLKRKFTFGMCPPGRILINQALAHDWVPDYVVLGTIYHEQLHEILGPDHDHQFLTAEQRFPHYAQANAWEDAHLDDLIAASKPVFGRE